MTTINSNSSFGENLLITLNAANNYSYTSVLDIPIVNKKFVRFLATYNAFVKINFISNCYIYNGSNPTASLVNLPYAKEAYVGKQEIWYNCDQLIKLINISVDTSLNTFTNGEIITILCEFITFMPKDLQEDV